MTKPPISRDMAFRRAEAAYEEFKGRRVEIDLAGTCRSTQDMGKLARESGLMPTSYHTHNPSQEQIDGIIIAKRHPSIKQYFSEISKEIILADTRAKDTARFLGRIIGSDNFIGPKDAIVIEGHMAELYSLARSDDPFGTCYRGLALTDLEPQMKFTPSSLLYHAFDVLVNKNDKVVKGGFDFYELVTRLFGIDDPDLFGSGGSKKNVPNPNVEAYQEHGQRADYIGRFVGSLSEKLNHTVLIVGSLDLYVMREEGIENYYGSKNILALEWVGQDSN